MGGAARELGRVAVVSVALAGWTVGSCRGSTAPAPPETASDTIPNIPASRYFARTRLGNSFVSTNFPAAALGERSVSSATRGPLTPSRGVPGEFTARQVGVSG